jgi:hypothetical protein
MLRRCERELWVEGERYLLLAGDAATHSRPASWIIAQSASPLAALPTRNGIMGRPGGRLRPECDATRRIRSYIITSA